MIIEGLLTTTQEDGSPHVAALGPVVNEELTRWTLRPFASSNTFRWLRLNSHCAFHVVDDVVPVVEAALGFPSSLQFERRQSALDDSQFWVIPSACHWYHLQVTQWDLSEMRSQATATPRDSSVLRPFWGWNRAKHAILEATILATRLHLADRQSINEDLKRLEAAIEKTAGHRELEAWQMLQDYFASH